MFSVVDCPAPEQYDRWALEVLAAFGLDHSTLVFLGHNSGIAYRFSVPAGKEFLLKIHVSRGSSESVDPALIEAGLRWLIDLSKLEPGFPVQAPLLDRSGRVLVEVPLDGLSADAFCSVQAWIDGEVLESDLNEIQAGAIGRMTARLHKCATMWKHSRPAAVGSVHDAEWFQRRIDQMDRHLTSELIETTDRATIKAAGQSVLHTLSGLDARSETFGPIHGDLHQENIVWFGDDPRPIDFAYLRLGPRSWDLGVLAYHSMYLPTSVRRCLIDAYLTESQGSEITDLALEVFLVAAAIDNLAYQVSITEQRTSPLLKRNLTRLAREYCRWLLEGQPFVLA